MAARTELAGFPGWSHRWTLPGTILCPTEPWARRWRGRGCPLASRRPAWHILSTATRRSWF